MVCTLKTHFRPIYRCISAFMFLQENICRGHHSNNIDNKGSATSSILWLNPLKLRHLQIKFVRNICQKKEQSWYISLKSYASIALCYSYQSFNAIEKKMAFSLKWWHHEICRLPYQPYWIQRFPWIQLDKRREFCSSSHKYNKLKKPLRNRVNNKI